MATEVERLVVRIVADTSSFLRSIPQVTGGIKQLERQSAKWQRKVEDLELRRMAASEEMKRHVGFGQSKETVAHTALWSRRFDNLLRAEAEAQKRLQQVQTQLEQARSGGGAPRLRASARRVPPQIQEALAWTKAVREAKETAPERRMISFRKKLAENVGKVELSQMSEGAKKVEQVRYKLNTARINRERKEQQKAGKEMMEDATKQFRQRENQSQKLKINSARLATLQADQADKKAQAAAQRTASYQNRLKINSAALATRQAEQDQKKQDAVARRLADAQRKADKARFNQRQQLQINSTKLQEREEKRLANQRAKAVRQEISAQNKARTQGRAAAGFIGGGLGGVIGSVGGHFGARAGGFFGAALGGAGGGGPLGGVAAGLLGGAGGAVVSLLASLPRLGMSFGKYVFGIGVGAFQSLETSIANTVVESVKAYASLEQLRVTFETMTGSAEKGDQLVKHLQRMGAVLPVSSEALQSSAKLLLQYGVSAENVIPILKMIGDISGGSADKMRRISLAYGQIVSAGRLLGTEVRQLAEAGWNPLENIAKATGKTVVQLRDEMSQGLHPTVGDVTRSMITATSEGGRFNRLMERMSGTLAGSWRMAGSQVLLIMQEIGAGVAKGFNLQGIMSAVTAGIKDVAMPAAVQLKNTLMAFSPAFEQIKSAAVSAWDWTEPVRASITDLFIAIQNNALVLWNSLWQNATLAWDGISRAAGISWNGVRDSIVSAIDTATFVIEHFDRYSAVIWDSMGYKIRRFWENDLPKYAAVGFMKVVNAVLSSMDMVTNILRAYKWGKWMFGFGTDASSEQIEQAKKHIKDMENLRKDFDKWMLERDEKRRQMAEERAKKAAAKPPEIPPLRIPPEWDQKMDKVKEKIQGTFNIARYASAEAVSRIEAYIESLTPKGPLVNPQQDRMVPTSSGTTRRTQDTTKPIVDELKRANTHLRDIKNKPTAEIEDADL